MTQKADPIFLSAMLNKAKLVGMEKEKHFHPPPWKEKQASIRFTVVLIQIARLDARV